MLFSHHKYYNHIQNYLFCFAWGGKNKTKIGSGPSNPKGFGNKSDIIDFNKSNKSNKQAKPSESKNNKQAKPSESKNNKQAKPSESKQNSKSTLRKFRDSTISGAMLGAGKYAKRQNIRINPNIENVYGGTRNRTVSVDCVLTPMNAEHSRLIANAILDLKMMMTGTNLGSSKAGLLISQDNTFTIEFGSTNLSKNSNFKRTTNDLLQINQQEETEFNITKIMTKYDIINGIFNDGLPKKIELNIDLEEKRPLRLLSEDSKVGTSSSLSGSISGSGIVKKTQATVSSVLKKFF